MSIYSEGRGKSGGLEFPGGDEAQTIWDFVYFSFVVGMTAQVSDVMVISRPIRRTVTAHGICVVLVQRGADRTDRQSRRAARCRASAYSAAERPIALWPKRRSI